jgi:hypothetical protein
MDFRNSIDYSKGDQLLLLEILTVMKELRDEIKEMNFTLKRDAYVNERKLQMLNEMTEGPNTLGLRKLVVTRQ